MRRDQLSSSLGFEMHLSAEQRLEIMERYAARSERCQRDLDKAIQNGRPGREVDELRARRNRAEEDELDHMNRSSQADLRVFEASADSAIETMSTVRTVFSRISTTAMLIAVGGFAYGVITESGSIVVVSTGSGALIAVVARGTIGILREHMIRS